jgi:hypothetical protein
MNNYTVSSGLEIKRSSSVCQKFQVPRSFRWYGGGGKRIEHGPSTLNHVGASQIEIFKSSLGLISTCSSIISAWQLLLQKRLLLLIQRAFQPSYPTEHQEAVAKDSIPSSSPYFKLALSGRPNNNSRRQWSVDINRAFEL